MVQSMIFVFFENTSRGNETRMWDTRAHTSPQLVSAILMSMYAQAERPVRTCSSRVSEPAEREFIVRDSYFLLCM